MESFVMQRSLLMLAILLGVGIIATETLKANSQADPLVKRGEYLVLAAAACVDCHGTAKDPYVPVDDVYSVGLGGGGAFRYQPFGVVYAPNLTVLQAWTDQELEQAIRYGVRPDGSVLLPPMPYEAYASLSEPDMAAIIAYLRSLSPIDNAVLPAELEPGLQRDTIRSLPEATRVEVPPRDVSVEYGQYLGVVVAACGQCHGACLPKGGIDLNAPMTGDQSIYTRFDVFSPPPLLHENLAQLDDASLLAYLGTNIEDQEAVAFMPLYAYAHLTEQDRQALFLWLRSIAD
jgi:mono/diheme cytochrome c family protein